MIFVIMERKTYELNAKYLLDKEILMKIDWISAWRTCKDFILSLALRLTFNPEKIMWKASWLNTVHKSFSISSCCSVCHIGPINHFFLALQVLSLFWSLFYLKFYSEYRIKRWFLCRCFTFHTNENVFLKLVPGAVKRITDIAEQDKNIRFIFPFHQK